MSRGPQLPPPPRLEGDLRVRRGAFLLDARFEIREPAVALFGPSGAGKTTLVETIAGLHRPEQGRLHLDGIPLVDVDAGVFVPPERRRLGVVFQEARLFPHLSVRENLRFGERLCPRPERRLELERIVSLLGLKGLLRRRPRSLSGGETRLVALGRALLTSPRLLLLDEPLAGLDEGRKRRVLEILSRIRGELGLPLLIVSHDPRDFLQLTSSMVVLEGGSILGQGELTSLLREAPIFRLLEALGLENLLTVELVGRDPAAGGVRALLGDQELLLPPLEPEEAELAGRTALVGLRPEDVMLSVGPLRGISAQNDLRGRVERVTEVCGRQLVLLDVGQPLQAEVTARSVQELEITPGRILHCLIKTFSFRWRSTRRGA